MELSVEEPEVFQRPPDVPRLLRRLGAASVDATRRHPDVKCPLGGDDDSTADSASSPARLRVVVAAMEDFGAQMVLIVAQHQLKLSGEKNVDFFYFS